MTYYIKEVNRIKKTCYSKQWQIDTVIDIRNFIEKNYQNNLRLDELARFRFTSKYHLLRIFKRYYGITPKQYLRSKRIEKSKELLRQGLTVTETCYSVGFESPASFSTLFKNKNGLTPSRFQKEQLSISD